MKEIFFLVIIIMAILAIETRKLRNSIIYLGVFSLIIAFVYAIHGAPDVAIAEAIIGSTMATILYMVAFQKYRIFAVYIIIGEDLIDDKIYKDDRYHSILEETEKYCSKNNLEMMPIYTVESVESINTNHRYGLIIKESEGQYQFYIHEENAKSKQVITFLENLELFEFQCRKLVD